jgi:hypothetical protein
LGLGGAAASPSLSTSVFLITLCFVLVAFTFSAAICGQTDLDSPERVPRISETQPVGGTSGSIRSKSSKSAWSHCKSNVTLCG